MEKIDFITLINSHFPQSKSADWDNVGWQIINGPKEINNVLICLDVTQDAVDYACTHDIDLILHHHPFAYGGWRNIKTDIHKQKILQQLKLNKVGLFALHTNHDQSADGGNVWILEALECLNIEPITFDQIVWGGSIVPTETLETIINRCQKLWPEEPIHYHGSLSSSISKIFVCTGAGGDLLPSLPITSDTVFITGEMKWNVWLKAAEIDAKVIVLTHFMENIFCQALLNWMQINTPSVNVIKYNINSPIKVWK